MVHRSYRRHRRASVRPVIVFLLIAGFGILFAGCREHPEEVVFRAEDMVRLEELSDQAEKQSGTGALTASGSLRGESGSLSSNPIVLDLSLAQTYTAMRTTGGSAVDEYRVTSESLPVRKDPAVSAAEIERVSRGKSVRVLDFPTAAWAKVKTLAGKEGFVSTRYIARVTSEEKLASEKQRFEGMQFVNFSFVNVRKDPNSQSEKLGQIDGQTILKPLSISGEWARVPFEGKEGYVSTQYLAPFLPSFLVRQETFTLPILHYDAGMEGGASSLANHIDRLRKDGMVPADFRSLRDLLLSQQERDVRSDPRSVLIAVSGVTPQNIRVLSDALVAKDIPATLFIETRHLGLSGITEKTVLTLIANGFDLQSAGHTGDDLRSLTNAQVELELQQSRALLEEWTRRPVFAVSYPQGGANERVMEIAAKAGYLLGFSDVPDRTFTRSQLLRLPSITVTPVMTEDEMVKAVKGSEG